MTMLETLANTLWQAESIRATGKPRREPWEDQAEETRAKWLFMARVALIALWKGAAMTDYTIEYYAKEGMENVPDEHHDFVVMVNGKGGLRIAGYVSRELAEYIKTLRTAANRTA